MVLVTANSGVRVFQLFVTFYFCLTLSIFWYSVNIWLECRKDLVESKTFHRFFLFQNNYFVIFVKWSNIFLSNILLCLSNDQTYFCRTLSISGILSKRWPLSMLPKGLRWVLGGTPASGSVDPPVHVSTDD